MDERSAARISFPTAAGVLLGVGLGGFFDGIVFHQILQWHHMLTSAGVPADSPGNLKLNILADGLFHGVTFVATALGVFLLWRSGHVRHPPWLGRWLAGAILAGFGGFNLVEGLVNHHWLGLHHVNETVPRAQWIWWDLAYLAWGAVMLIAGWVMLRSSRGAAAQA